MNVEILRRCVHKLKHITHEEESILRNLKKNLCKCYSVLQSFRYHLQYSFEKSKENWSFKWEASYIFSQLYIVVKTLKYT